MIMHLVTNTLLSSVAIAFAALLQWVFWRFARVPDLSGREMFRVVLVTSCVTMLVALMSWVVIKIVYFNDPITKIDFLISVFLYVVVSLGVVDRATRRLHPFE